MGSILGQVSLGKGTCNNAFFRRAMSRRSQLDVDCKVLFETPDTAIASSGGGSLDSQGLCIALDGHLHTPDNLAGKLGLRPDTTQANLLGSAWQEWGEDLPLHLPGDFAIALHDQAANRILLVRDHIGTRPLYWHWNEGKVLFATFLPDLLDLLDTPPPTDEATVAQFLRLPIVLGDKTFFKGIQAVKPGCLVSIDASGPRACKWWRPESLPPVRLASPEEYANAVRTLTEQAVRTRIPDARPVGAHLSGGIDSTTVALIAEEILTGSGRNLNGVYSWSPPISDDAPSLGDSDERLRIQKICFDAGLKPRFGALSGKDMYDALRRPIELEGIADVFDEFSILDQANSDGVSVLLSGWGGDEAFSAHANSLPAYLLKSGRTRDLARLIRSFHRGYRGMPRVLRTFWDLAVVPLLPGPLRSLFVRGDHPYVNGCYAASDIPDDVQANPNYLVTRPPTDPTRHLREMIEAGHVGERMATWAAWSAPHGLEYRYPLTDRCLIEFILSIPAEILWGDNRSRYLAREVIKGRIATGVGKSDPANERKRIQAMRACWKLLGAEVAAGKFDAECRWLDMPTLRADLLRGPTGEDLPDVRAFARIMPAIRIWHMATRMGVVARVADRQAIA